MGMLIRCEGASCNFHPVLGSILDDGTLRQLVRGHKFHVREGRVTVGHRDCGYEREVIIPFPVPEFRP